MLLFLGYGCGLQRFSSGRLCHSPRLCPRREEWRKGVFVSLKKFRSSRNRKDIRAASLISCVADSGILLSEITER